MEQLFSLKQNQNIADLSPEQIRPFLKARAIELACKHDLLDHCDNLRRYFDRAQFPIKENDFLIDKKELYNLENPMNVHARVEKRLQLKQLIQEVTLTNDKRKKAVLEERIKELMEELEGLQSPPEDKNKKQEFIEQSQNALRTRWATDVFAEMDVAFSEVLQKNIGDQEIFQQVKVLHNLCVNMFRDFLSREKKVKNSEQPVDVTVLNTIYADKTSFIENEMKALYDLFVVCVNDFLQKLSHSEMSVFQPKKYSLDFVSNKGWQDNPQNQSLAILYKSMQEFLAKLPAEDFEKWQKKLNQIVDKLAK